MFCRSWFLNIFRYPLKFYYATSSLRTFTVNDKIREDKISYDTHKCRSPSDTYITIYMPVAVDLHTESRPQYDKPVTNQHGLMYT